MSLFPDLGQLYKFFFISLRYLLGQSPRNFSRWAYARVFNLQVG